ncbi:MAG TPA: protein translocase subunit SecD, partial [Chthoniobacteraceae bacterium]|nr:protein translocase subunit SecD [Chthoniobacteraceae bacterium]
MNSAGFTFTYGISILILLGWYFATDEEKRKRTLGTVLTLVIIVFCFINIYPPFDVRDSSGKLIKTGRIHLGLDLQGGTSFLVRLTPLPEDDGSVRPITPQMVDQAVEAFRKRMDPYGTSEPIIIPQGSDSILVQIPGLHDADQVADAKKQLEQVAKLEFKLVPANSAELVAAIEAKQRAIPAGYELATLSESRNGKPFEQKILIEKKSRLDGTHVKKAFAVQETDGWIVSMHFDSDGAKEFATLTRQVAIDHSQMAIVLDGRVISAPGVDERYAETGIMGGDAQISGGGMDQKSSNELATALQNPLQTPVKIMDTRSSSATLGADSIKSGIYSALAGLVLVAIFMILYYHVVGFIAIVALVINCVMVVGSLAIFNSVLTLPGIAGLILSLGIAIDANVLIYERLREELDHGKAIRPAVDASYGKAFSAIFDAHVTQFLTAAVLFWLASGPVKGFALTLTIGIVASMFSSLLITYTCFSWIFAAGWLRKITMLHLIPAQAFDFVGHSKKFMTISAVLVLGSIGIIAMRGEKNLGADFRGGDQIIFTAQQKLTVSDVLKALEGTGFDKTSVIQEQKSATEDLLTIRNEYGTADKIQDALKKNLSSAGLEFQATTTVGSLVGKELATRSALALGIGLICIFVYVAARFETSFAIGAIVALAHDLIIVLGCFSLAGRELSLIMVGALLSIAGYSINDKVVVFDRIRSGLRDNPGGNTASIINTSINETLSRTILTGGTAFLTVVALYLFGGPVLNDFAF